MLINQTFPKGVINLSKDFILIILKKATAFSLFEEVYCEGHHNYLSEGATDKM